jgi:hypothetical protein
VRVGSRLEGTVPLVKLWIVHWESLALILEMGAIVGAAKALQTRPQSKMMFLRSMMTTEK